MEPEAMSIQAMYDRIRLLENEYIEGTGNHNVRHWNADTIQAQCAELERMRPPAPDADQMLQSRGSAGASKSPPREFWDKRTYLNFNHQIPAGYWVQTSRRRGSNLEIRTSAGELKFRNLEQSIPKQTNIHTNNT